MAGLVGRLREWSEIRRVRPAEELPDVTGGRDAEIVLKDLVGSSFHFKDAHVLAGRRIPSRRQGRRREIDLIVCTPRMIHLIEVKNWSGRLDVRGGSWRQTRRGGDVVDHGDLVATNLLKRDAVAEYLADRGVPLDERFVRDHIVPKIIFMNPKLELDPAVEARPDVISRRELDEYLGRQRTRSLAERMFSSLVETCLAAESKAGRILSGKAPTGPQYERIVACLSEAGGWDRLHLYGNRVINGDLVGLKLGPRTYRKPELAELSGSLPIRVRWSRGPFWGLVKAVTGFGTLGSLDLGKRRIEVSPGDTVMFHAAGDREPTSRRLVELERIVMD